MLCYCVLSIYASPRVEISSNENINGEVLLMTVDEAITRFGEPFSISYDEIENDYYFTNYSYLNFTITSFSKDPEFVFSMSVESQLTLLGFIQIGDRLPEILIEANNRGISVRRWRDSVYNIYLEEVSNENLRRWPIVTLYFTENVLVKYVISPGT